MEKTIKKLSTTVTRYFSGAVNTGIPSGLCFFGAAITGIPAVVTGKPIYAILIFFLLSLFSIFSLAEYRAELTVMKRKLRQAEKDAAHAKRLAEYVTSTYKIEQHREHFEQIVKKRAQ